MIEYRQALKVATPPIRVRWTDHALVKAAALGTTQRDVEHALLENHDRRRRNPGPAEWRVTANRLVILYDFPYRGDASLACIVTLWRYK